MACLAQIARGCGATWTVRLPALPTGEYLPVRLPPSSERKAAPGSGQGERRRCAGPAGPTARATGPHAWGYPGHRGQRPSCAWHPHAAHGKALREGGLVIDALELSAGRVVCQCRGGAGIMDILDDSTVRLGTTPHGRGCRARACPPRAQSRQRPAPGQVEDTQLGTHTQHAPLLTLHEPADDVTSQGADTRVSKLEALQSPVSPHTATVWAATHTQHAPPPT